MPLYDYVCNDCAEKLAQSLHRQPDNVELAAEAVFETEHTMMATDAQKYAATECPRCLGHNTQQFMGSKQIIAYIRGDGYLDKKGVHRDMNVHKLETDDPYAEYRQAGEVDDLKDRMRRAGQHNPNKKHYQACDTADVNKTAAEVAKQKPID
jgi:hypothetical protein